MFKTLACKISVKINILNYWGGGGGIPVVIFLLPMVLFSILNGVCHSE